MSKVVIVGGGIIGTMHAYFALEKGHDVVHLERDSEPRQASVRNLGLLWLSGRASGPELDLAVRARELWEKIGAEVPLTGYRSRGSLTLLTREDEISVAKAALETKDATRRGLVMLDRKGACELNPALSKGTFKAALYGQKDALVEPRAVLGALRDACSKKGNYAWMPTHEVDVVGDHFVHAEGTFEGEHVIVCPGASLGGPFADVLNSAPLTRIRLQMMETDIYDGSLTTSVADGDSFRYYPAFDDTAMLPQDNIAANFEAQLLCVQRSDGRLTIGDTHGGFGPFDYDSDAENHLLSVAGSFLGALPAVKCRWIGTYARHSGPQVYFRSTPYLGVSVITGLGGRGMTLSPAVAEESFQ